jgi:pyoluteorin transport system permease protein
MTLARTPRWSPLSTKKSAKLRRVAALVRKETYQLFRDPSSIAIGVVMPVVLILFFGYALSLDVENVPVAVVLEGPSPTANELAAGFALSPYFQTSLLTSMPRAQQLLLQRKVDGIIRLRPDFARRLNSGNGEAQILVYGTDANRARIIEAYAQGAAAQFLARRAAEGNATAGAGGGGSAVVQSRLWYNEADDSHYFLVPGLIVLIMTLIGAFLTALVMAREWERGTLEALFVTPMRAGEIVLAKMIPYFVLGMIGLALCIFSAKFLFHVPFRGSVSILTAVSMLYLLVALAIGLLISSITKSQFVASMATMVITFLPALFLSGFLFDVRSMPVAIRILSYALPARYYVGLLQTLFLAGNIWGVVVPDAAVLAGMAFALLVLTRAVAKKRLV